MLNRSDLKKYAMIAGASALVIILIVVAIVTKRTVVEVENTVEGIISEVKPDAVGKDVKPVAGYIESGDTTSNMERDMFVVTDGGKYMIKALSFDTCTTGHAIRNMEDWAFTNGATTVSMPTGEKYYTIGSKKIKDDHSYIPAVVVDDQVYVDCDKLFNSFGYTTQYAENINHDVIRLIIQGDGNDTYDTISPSKPVDIQPEIPEETIEYEENGNGMLVVPPAEDDSAFWASQEDPEIAAAEIINAEYPSGYTQEDMDNIWETDKKEIEKIFKDGSPAAGNIGFYKRTENELVFNPMRGAIYIDTVDVMRPDITPNGEYIIATFSGEWGDQTGETTVDNKAFYECLPELYRKTICTLLGDTEGMKLFNFIKSHADIKQKGGYIPQRNHDGSWELIETDQMTGDGVSASSINFSDWQARKTDDGLWYDVTQYGNGFRITIYK